MSQPQLACRVIGTGAVLAAAVFGAGAVACDRSVAPLPRIEGTYSVEQCAYTVGGQAVYGGVPCIREAGSAAFTLVDSGSVVIDAIGGIHWIMHCRASSSGAITVLNEDVTGTYTMDAQRDVNVSLPGSANGCRPTRLYWDGKQRIGWSGARETVVLAKP